MSKKWELSQQRAGTIINKTSKKQESLLDKAVIQCTARLLEKFSHGNKTLKLYHEKSWKLKDIVSSLRRKFPHTPFNYYHDSSSMRPDGGILYLISQDGDKLPILISEKKNQGTNDFRLKQGKLKQAKGNAIERLGKNVIGFRTAMRTEHIFPFVCFGDGCDFVKISSILDRVVTIAQFGVLNQECVHNLGEKGEFNRGSFFFRPEEWTQKEMEDICFNIGQSSIYYYFSKYGEEAFMKESLS